MSQTNVSTVFVPQELLMPTPFIQLQSVHIVVENTFHRFLIFFLGTIFIMLWLHCQCHPFSVENTKVQFSQKNETVKTFNTQMHVYR